ncbi:DUF2336 domain-containing protein [Ponticaulis sp.]|uniref:DUF2336 domain-containing protein n=1 Tax=Ponticaulis sp. TaxID=2020902 RepID=UPI000B6410F5|nr:DUF2336 domain-containing protein [Ponticaulis sp.]MAI90307.1 hypothetical protein [Ponticaulis sp.]OUX99946.1 MAG: hypothetical protein CBB65_07690 [Hyphomonadaceae bacterium TMED5]
MATDPALILTETVPEPTTRRARMTLLRRLIDVVAMPSSRIPPQDRSMAGDILLEMLFDAEESERAFCAKRLVPTQEAPRRVLRYLAMCDIEVARELLQSNESFDDSDINFILRHSSPSHAEAIAKRKTLGPSICDTLVELRHLPAIEDMLKSRRSFVSETAMDDLMEFSRAHPHLCALMIDRDEMTPNHAMTMFWWSGEDERRKILMKFAADRSELIDICGDIFAMASAEGWADPVTRKTLQLIERRQRSRAAIERSPYESLEEAIEVAEKQGLTRDTAQEVGHLAGIKPVTAAKILTDPGGEAIAVFCKATGLKRHFLMRLWAAMRRPTEIGPGVLHPQYERIREIYEMMSVAKAQTVLRYWNWSLSSSFSVRPADLEDEDAGKSYQFSTSLRTARLVFGAQNKDKS